MRQQNWQNAQKSLEGFIQKNPRDGEAHLLLAEVYGELNLVHSMQTTLANLRQISPKYENSAHFIAKKYWIKNFNQGLQFIEQSRYQEAINKIQLAVMIDTSNTKSLQLLADVLFRTARYHDSQNAYLKVLRKEPENLTIMNNLAEIYFINKQYPKAIDLCTKILDAKLLSINALMRRAYAYDALGKYEQAINDFELLAELNATPKLLTDFGLIYFRQKKYHQAIDYFNAALDTSSNNYLLYRYLGEANWQLRNYQDMVKWYQKIVEFSPDDLLGWKNLALAYEALGQKELLVEARIQIDKIIRNN